VKKTLSSVALALALAVGVAPLATIADPQFQRAAPVSDHWFPTLYVRTGSSVDVQLVDGDTLTSQAIVADPRWNMTTFNSGPQNVPHVILKPSGVLPTKQLLTIPGARFTYHVLLESGTAQSSAYTLRFYESGGSRRIAASPPAPPKLATIKSCANPAPGTTLTTAYKMSGDPRISVKSVCDDGTHTFVIMNPGRGPAVIPYSIDSGGKQDQLVNTVWSPELSEWVIAGVYDKLALLSDSSTGQIRVNLEREGGVK